MALDSTSLKEMIFRFLSDETSQKGMKFQPRPSDVIISTPLKCGTTWMQQITHQLRSGGDMEFDNIYDVVPWIELAYDWQINLDAEQKGTPRLYKTHHPYNCCSKVCRYIVVFRNPCSTAYSFYKFMIGKSIPENVSIEEFVKNAWLAFGDPINTVKPTDVSYFTHLLSWFDHRNDPNILVLFFEEMKEDLETVVRALSTFLGIHDEEKIPIVVENSSFEFMKANEDKFSPKKFVPDLPRLLMLRTGSVDEAMKVFSEDLKAVIQDRWEKEITGVTGYKTYEELRRGFRKERPLKHL